MADECEVPGCRHIPVVQVNRSGRVPNTVRQNCQLEACTRFGLVEIGEPAELCVWVHAICGPLWVGCSHENRRGLGM